MSIGKIFKRSIQVLAGLFLCLSFGWPLANMWLEAHPEAGTVLDQAARQVDPDAGRLEQVGQLAGNIGKARDEVAEQDREAASEKERRKQDEMRRFNAGEDDY